MESVAPTFVPHLEDFVDGNKVTMSSHPNVTSEVQHDRWLECESARNYFNSLCHPATEKWVPYEPKIQRWFLLRAEEGVPPYQGADIGSAIRLANQTIHYLTDYFPLKQCMRFQRNDLDVFKQNVLNQISFVENCSDEVKELSKRVEEAFENARLQWHLGALLLRDGNGVGGGTRKVVEALKSKINECKQRKIPVCEFREWLCGYIKRLVHYSRCLSTYYNPDKDKEGDYLRAADLEIEWIAKNLDPIELRMPALIDEFHEVYGKLRQAFPGETEQEAWDSVRESCDFAESYTVPVIEMGLQDVIENCRSLMRIAQIVADAIIEDPENGCFAGRALDDKVPPIQFLEEACNFVADIKGSDKKLGLNKTIFEMTLDRDRKAEAYWEEFKKGSFEKLREFKDQIKKGPISL